MPEWIGQIVGPLTGAVVVMIAGVIWAQVRQHFAVKQQRRDFDEFQASVHRRLDAGAAWRKEHDGETGRIERLILESEQRIREDMHQETASVRDRISRLEGKIGNGH